MYCIYIILKNKMNAQTNISTTVPEVSWEKSLLKLETLLEQKYNLNSDLIEKLLQDIKEVFWAKVRNDGSHYIEHLITTLNYANGIDWWKACNEEMIIIALLHDIYEENPEKASLDYLRTRYNPKISIAIDILSKSPKVLWEDWKQGKEQKSKRNTEYFKRFESLEQLKREIQSRAQWMRLSEEIEEITKLAEIIAIVKIWDRVHNLSTETKKGKIKETEKYFWDLVDEIWWRAKNYIRLAISWFRFQLALHLSPIKIKKILDSKK